MAIQKNKRKSRKKTKRKPDVKHFLLNKLRRASYMWPPRKEAIQAAKVERGRYKCARCEGIFGPKEIQLDHKKPVIDPEDGFIDWNNYIERLFCDVDSFQVLCRICHGAKTNIENEIRKQVKRKDDRSGDGDI